MAGMGDNLTLAQRNLAGLQPQINAVQPFGLLGLYNPLGNGSSKILQMGELVGDQISSANALLVHYDATIAERIITTDRKVNGMNKDVHKLSERLIALRQPVALDVVRLLREEGGDESDLEAVDFEPLGEQQVFLFLEQPYCETST